MALRTSGKSKGIFLTCFPFNNCLKIFRQFQRKGCFAVVPQAPSTQRIMVALEDIDLFWGIFEKFAFYKSVGGKNSQSRNF